MKVKKIYEELYTSAKDSGNIWIPIYILKADKDKEDFNKAAGQDREVRFIANAKNQDLYIFNSDLLHEDAGKRLGISVYWTEEPVLAGRAFRSNEKWTVRDIFNFRTNFEVANVTRKMGRSGNEINTKHVLACLDANWSWMDKFIETSPYMKQAKESWDAKINVPEQHHPFKSLYPK